MVELVELLVCGAADVLCAEAEEAFHPPLVDGLGAGWGRARQVVELDLAPKVDERVVQLVEVEQGEGALHRWSERHGGLRSLGRREREART